MVGKLTVVLPPAPNPQRLYVLDDAAKIHLPIKTYEVPLEVVERYETVLPAEIVSECVVS